MTTPIQQHGSTPSDLGAPVQRSSSQTARSPNDNGGQVQPHSRPGTNAPVKP